MKLKELAELSGIKIIEKQQSGSFAWNIGFNDCKKLYDNLEIPIEKLMPSMEEIEKEINKCLNVDVMSEVKDVAQAIHNLKPGGMI